ncbi:hypothetical protein AABM38_02705 [Heyndrickxia sp. MSNUG]|uniref:hypothetical protein n=1 Tax=Heyndrickxia sp. MSNUG TaxID=3136677 RepID=UPI003C2D2320
MDNIISSLSLILGMFVAIYIKWLDEIKAANDIEFPTHRVDGGNEYNTVKRINKYYVLPLTIFSFVLTIVILPNWISIFSETIKTIADHPLNFKYYNIVSAIFLLIGLTSIVFTVHLGWSYYKLRIKTKKLNPKG